MEDSQQQQRSRSSHNEDGWESDRQREEEAKAFDETKGGVKGLVDSGISKIPHLFISYSSSSNHASQSAPFHLEIPVIDLSRVQQDGVGRSHIIEQVRHASETWGFFQVVNHGIPKQVLHDMMEGVRRFHQQPHHLKMEYYSRDTSKKARFFSNFDLFHSKAANWRDTFLCAMAPYPPHPQEIPAAFRYCMHYSIYIIYMLHQPLTCSQNIYIFM